MNTLWAQYATPLKIHFFTTINTKKQTRALHLKLKISEPKTINQTTNCQTQKINSSQNPVTHWETKPDWMTMKRTQGQSTPSECRSMRQGLYNLPKDGAIPTDKKVPGISIQNASAKRVKHLFQLYLHANNCRYAKRMFNSRTNVKRKQASINDKRPTGSSAASGLFRSKMCG